ncbi:hypothetical protein MSTE_02154 [Mycobacteroides stephanolepidis]|uniref:Secreted protein n=1 Tax=[Mycobacterium] stephanolepidis TaxID=1520670 RepID=A0A1Z4EX00_9MYCO|nr:hypothetical protein [[Mycobacterium] stephanolepidis]BAX97468.1 hypothetical protein MSTE_02154 [[Mycobacterium] stephanolepidis]
MNKIIKLGQAVLAAGVIAAPVAVINAGLASAQPSPAPADVCFNGPYPSPPPPWGPGTMEGCVNPDNWFSQWGWRYAGPNWRGEGGQLPPPAPNWKYVGPGCEYSSNPNWQYTGPDCQRETP